MPDNQSSLTAPMRRVLVRFQNEIRPLVPRTGHEITTFKALVRRGYLKWSENFMLGFWLTPEGAPVAAALRSQAPKAPNHVA